MSSTGIYFGSGPAMLPREVLSAFHSESMTFDRCQLQFYELSHRHPLSMERQQAIVGLFRQLFTIPDDYQVLFTASPSKSRIINKISKSLGIKISKIGKICKRSFKSEIIGEKGNKIALKNKGYYHRF